MSGQMGSARPVITGRSKFHREIQDGETHWFERSRALGI